MGEQGEPLLPLRTFLKSGALSTLTKNLKQINKKHLFNLFVSNFVSIYIYIYLFIYLFYLFIIQFKIVLYVRSGQVRSACVTCTFRANYCSARLSRAQVPAFAGSSVRDRGKKGVGVREGGACTGGFKGVQAVRPESVAGGGCFCMCYGTPFYVLAPPKFRTSLRSWRNRSEIKLR